MAALEEENLYKILGVPSRATQAEIQAAYKKKARELHPDVNKHPDAEDQFKQLAAAYAILKDEKQRARYDKYGISGSRRPDPPPRSQSRGQPRRKYTARDFGFNDINFDDIRVENDDLKNPFDFFLRREQKKRRREREVQLNISLEHAYKGTTLNMVLDLPLEDGRTETRKIKLKIPQGAKDGDRLKLKDPDVTVVLQLEKHEQFEVDGRDVSTHVDITPWEAALGGTVDVATPGGSVKLRIPEGTSSGQKLRLRGQGLPLKPGRQGTPGDFYITVKIVVPKNLSAKERELFEELARASNFDPRRGY
ncbi:MAG: DnaJ C-terminal domain-containing protein [Deltaproteobacteria bacterium]|jgi:curved DNA-binding protein